jgi:hypothetical protein
MIVYSFVAHPGRPGIGLLNSELKPAEPVLSRELDHSGRRVSLFGDTNGLTLRVAASCGLYRGRREWAKFDYYGAFIRCSSHYSRADGASTPRVC